MIRTVSLLNITRTGLIIHTVFLNSFICVSFRRYISKVSKAAPLHAMEAHGGRGGIAPTHT
jgi:hypothetical protein